MKNATFTAVERIALERSAQGQFAPGDERIPVIVVDNFPALGKLTALRFVEWMQHNPEGAISLPTGKTPEHFIKWVQHFLRNWNDKTVQKDLAAVGIDTSKKPDPRGLHFVQIDEFYPIDSAQENSFYSYVRRFYIDGFGLSLDRALLIDCNHLGFTGRQTLHSVWPDSTVDLDLRFRAAHTSLERTQQDALRRIDQWCQDYEEKIRALGGLGFFLGGIGPDGHIGFNVRGSDHNSTTRLTATNYETQAAAATDLGGVEVSRKRLVITIGLATMTYNPHCAAIIMAAGEAKAQVVADGVLQAPNVLYPATALQRLPNARFYLTAGGAKCLGHRQLAVLKHQPSLSDEQVERIVIDLSLSSQKRLLDLNSDDFQATEAGRVLLRMRPEQSADTIKQNVRDGIIRKIEAGAKGLTDTRFLHTEPHHDDVMLGYLPAVVRNVRSATNTHHFATLTSGFTAVTNPFLQRNLEQARHFLQSAHCRDLHAQGYFTLNNLAARNRDVWQYLDGVAACSPEMRVEGEARRMLRNLAEVVGTPDTDTVAREITDLLAYLQKVYPGQKDPPRVQQLKGMCREWEVECLWGYFGWNCSNIRHLRLGFYTGNIFTEEPTIGRDVPPVLSLLRETRPNIVTVALDPEASGPDTHYKVLQAVAAAVSQYQEGGAPAPTIWGYRNVWYRFHPSESNMYVPVSLNMFTTLENAFMNTFASQREASFPSYEHDGPFCQLAQKIQVQQYQMLKTLLGREWFYEHPSPLIRATRGFVFLKTMTAGDFQNCCRDLRRAAEDRK